MSPKTFCEQSKKISGISPTYFSEYFKLLGVCLSKLERVEIRLGVANFVADTLATRQFLNCLDAKSFADKPVAKLFHSSLELCNFLTERSLVEEANPILWIWVEMVDCEQSTIWFYRWGAKQPHAIKLLAVLVGECRFNGRDKALNGENFILFENDVWTIEASLRQLLPCNTVDSLEASRRRYCGLHNLNVMKVINYICFSVFLLL